jgi:hypothetical protein
MYSVSYALAHCATIYASSSLQFIPTMKGSFLTKVAAILSDAASWPSLLRENLFPEDIQSLRSRYNADGTGLISRSLFETGSQQGIPLRENGDGKTAEESDIFITLRSHELFVTNFLIWTSITIPLYFPSGMLISPSTSIDHVHNTFSCSTERVQL